MGANLVVDMGNGSTHRLCIDDSSGNGAANTKRMFRSFLNKKSVKSRSNEETARPGILLNPSSNTPTEAKTGQKDGAAAGTRSTSIRWAENLQRPDRTKGRTGSGRTGTGTGRRTSGSGLSAG